MNDVLKAIKAAEQALASARSVVGNHPGLAEEAARVKEAYGELGQIRLAHLNELLAVAKALGIGREVFMPTVASVDPQRDLPFHASCRGEEWYSAEQVALPPYGEYPYACEHLAKRIGEELARITRASQGVARSGERVKEVRALIGRAVVK